MADPIKRSTTAERLALCASTHRPAAPFGMRTIKRTEVAGAFRDAERRALARAASSDPLWAEIARSISASPLSESLDRLVSRVSASPSQTWLCPAAREHLAAESVAQAAAPPLPGANSPSPIPQTLTREQVIELVQEQQRLFLAQLRRMGVPGL